MDAGKQRAQDTRPAAPAKAEVPAAVPALLLKMIPNGALVNSATEEYLTMRNGDILVHFGKANFAALGAARKAIKVPLPQHCAQVLFAEITRLSGLPMVASDRKVRGDHSAVETFIV